MQEPIKVGGKWKTHYDRILNNSSTYRWVIGESLAAVEKMSRNQIFGRLCFAIVRAEDADQESNKVIDGLREDLKRAEDVAEDVDDRRSRAECNQRIAERRLEAIEKALVHDQKIIEAMVARIDAMSVLIEGDSTC